MKNLLTALSLCLFTGCAWWQPDGEKHWYTKSQALSAAVPGTASFAWDSSQSGVTYSIYQGGVSQVYTNIIKGITTKTYTITGLKPGARYYFAVAAVDASGIASKFSNEINYSVATNVVPVPTTKMYDQVAIERRVTAGAPWVAVSTNTFLVTNTLSTYREVVRRIKLVSTPGFSPPMPQRALVAAAPPQGLNLAWDASTDTVEGYTLRWGIEPGVYTNNVAVGNVTSYVVTGLVPGVKYYFAATATDGVLESLPSNEINYTVVPDVVPSGGTLVIVLWAGPPWTAISTNIISATNAQASYRQSVSLEP